MLDFREELIGIVESKTGNQVIKKAAENFLKQTLDVLQKTDKNEFERMKKLDFILTTYEVIVCIPTKKTSGVYFSNFKEYNKEVFEELRRRMKLEGFVFLQETENAFSIAIP